MPGQPDDRADRAALDPLLDAAPAGFLTVDDSGVVQRANATLAAYVGRDRSEIEGAHIDLLHAAAGRIFYSTHLFPMLRLHGHAEELYLPILHRDGTEIPFLVNGRTRTGGDRPLYDLVLMPMRQRNQLETELLETRNAAQQAAAAKDRFLSIVSHELRSPLAAISGYADLLLRERKGQLTEDQRRYAERIRDAGRHQLALIEDILDFAAIGERRELDAGALAIEEVLTRAEGILALRAQEEGCTLERRPRPAQGSVLADGRALQQVLLNLGQNAIKYGRAGGLIEIVAEQMAGRVQLRVIDQGAGIPPDQLDRIFEPFVQLPRDSAATTAKAGVGLGLAISRDLAHAMGGDLTVESEPGRGSTFTLDLPAA